MGIAWGRKFRPLATLGVTEGSGTIKGNWAVGAGTGRTPGEQGQSSLTQAQLRAWTGRTVHRGHTSIESPVPSPLRRSGTSDRCLPAPNGLDRAGPGRRRNPWRRQQGWTGLRALDPPLNVTYRGRESGIDGRSGKWKAISRPNPPSFDWPKEPGFDPASTTALPSRAGAGDQSADGPTVGPKEFRIRTCQKYPGRERSP